MLLLSVGCQEEKARASAPAAAVSKPAPAVASPAQPRPPAAPSFLKAQLHAHSDRSSDGHTPVTEVVEFYASHGYDVLAISDHNRITVSPAPPGGPLLVPAMELSQNSKICRPAPREGFRCLIHTNLLFADPSLDEQRGARRRMPFEDERYRAYRAQLAEARKLGGIGVLNHPFFHHAADARLIVRLAREQNLRLLEVVNAGLNAEWPGGVAAAEQAYEKLWDEVLSKDVEVYGIATDDAHHFGDAERRRKLGKSAYTGDRAWVMVRAARSGAALRAALLAGDFYASTGVELAELDSSRGRVVLRVRAASERRYTTRFVGAGGRLLAEVDGLRAEYRPRGDELYVRATVSDDQGKKAWVQPSFLALPR